MFWNFKGFKKVRCVLNPANPALKSAGNAGFQKYLVFETGKKTRFFLISAGNAGFAGYFLLIVRRIFLIISISQHVAKSPRKSRKSRSISF